MGVRLNKVLTELNIGLQTAVDFLKRKSSLGEIRDDATTNTKITDEQYEALVREFSGDKAVKTQAEKLFTKMKEKKDKKPAEKHTAPAEEKSVETTPVRQQFKPLGKIDLDSLNKPKAKPADGGQSGHHHGQDGDCTALPAAGSDAHLLDGGGLQNGSDGIPRGGL